MTDGSEGELILYRTEDGKAAIQLRAVEGTVWLSQAEIAALFDTTPQNITLHLRNVQSEGELDVEATCKDRLQVQIEGEGFSGGCASTASTRSWLSATASAARAACSSGAGPRPSFASISSRASR